MKMKDKYTITIFATTLSILFAVVLQFTPNYASLVLNLEVITLPVIYVTGYEIMMEKQKFIYERHLLSLESKIKSLNRRLKQGIK